MTVILGISAYYHDSAAALVEDGRIVAAAQEERFSRQKNDARFPQMAIESCLRTAGLDVSQIDHVCFYDKPLKKFDRLLETYLAFAPRGLRSFLQSMPLWLDHKLFLPREIRRGLSDVYDRRILFTEHHASHAASAFFPSPFEEAAILTVDGVGEWATASFGVGSGHRIHLSHELHFPHSLGLLYAAFTSFCGFAVNSGEYKLMGLAPYGDPTYADRIRKELIEISPDGSLRMDQSYFNYCQGLTMTSRKFERLFDGPPRRRESPVTQREMDLAASIQVVTEEVLLQAARYVHAQTGQRNLCLAGGVALNCVANARLLREGPFETIWIQPAAGDAGGALGAALFTWHQLLEQPRELQTPDGQQGSLLGPSFPTEQVRAALDKLGASYEYFDDEHQLCQHVAQLLAEQQVVGWMQGRMEFGPRALGARSILADPRSATMRDRLNRQIKGRESFRPFAPAVLSERTGEYFEMPRGQHNRYMQWVAEIAVEKQLDVAEDQVQGLQKLALVRSAIPAVTHVNRTVRVQVVDSDDDRRFRQLLLAFEGALDCPVLLNTSFNFRDEPIVCSPEDAYRCFQATGIDTLVIEHFVLRKDRNSTADGEGDVGGKPQPPPPAKTLTHRPALPSAQQLLGFHIAWFLAFCLLAIAWQRAAARDWAFGSLLVAMLIPAVGWLYPPASRVIYLALAWLSFPIGWLVSRTLLVLVFFLIVTPIGLLLRSVHYDPLQIRDHSAADSYWRPRDTPVPPEDSFRQY